MAKNVTSTASLSRAAKTLAQAFFAAAAEVPEASRGEIVKGALGLIRQQVKAAHDKAIAAKKKLQEIAAKKLGGKPEQYQVGNERVFSKSGANMTLAQAAKYAIQLGGIYDGHEAPADVHKLTQASVAALAGQGLVAAAKDNYPRDGSTFSYVASFAEVEVDVETGKYYIVD